MAYNNNQLNFMLLEELNEVINRHQHNLHRRTLRDAANPFQLDTDIFVASFRVSKNIARNLIESLRVHIDHQQRTTGIPLELKVLSTLYFFGHGSYQKCIGQSINMPLQQSTFSKILSEVSESIVTHMMPQWIVFPQNEREFNEVKAGFLRYGMRGVIGAIDCTHVAIIAPKTDDPVRPGLAYFNRKGFYSINVQAICDSNLKITNCNARFPGSSHDSGIWELSALRRLLENKYVAGELNQSWLIGDSGYPLQPWLFTPVPDAPEHTAEGQYNATHIRARNCIERCFGVLKQRFRCLLKHRVLHYDPVKAAKIIYSCIVLHNMVIHDKLPPLEELEEQEMHIPEDVPGDVQDANRGWLGEGRRMRQRFIRDNFE